MSKITIKLDCIDILLDERFVKNVFKAAILSSRTGYETSFAVNLHLCGMVFDYTNTKLVFNSVLIEEVDNCPSSGEEAEYFEGHGLHISNTPDDERLIGLHFHPPVSMAIPSAGDLMNLYRYKCLSVDLKINPVSIIGHRRGLITTLFLMQFTEIPFVIYSNEQAALIDDEEQMEMAYEILESMANDVKSRLSDKYGHLNYDSKTIPQEYAELLNSRGFIKAGVIAFKSKEEYLKEVSKLANTIFF